MSSRAPCPWHSLEFKRQLCREIRAGELRRNEAQQKHQLFCGARAHLGDPVRPR